MFCSVLLFTSFGLKYGIPKFKPLRIKIIASIDANTGMKREIFCLNFKEIKFPAKDTPNIMGIVPVPNKAIYRIPFKRLPVAIAPAIPIYTKPHGKNPFTIPIRKSEP